MYKIDVKPHITPIPAGAPGARFSLKVTAYSVAYEDTPVFTSEQTPDCWIFEYVDRGRGVLELPPEKYYPAEGDVYILPKKRRRYSFHHDPQDRWAKIAILADGPLLEELISYYGLDGACYFKECFDLKEMFLAFYDLRPADKLVHHKALLLFQRIFLGLMSAGNRVEDKIPSTAKVLRKFLDDNVEASVTLDDFCTKHKTNKEHAIRVFKKNYDTTPYNYLMRKKIDMAATLLRYSDVSIKEIADRLCFTDQYHFSKYFKKTTGMSPSMFKRRIV